MTQITEQQLKLFLMQSIENATMMIPDCKTFIYSRGKYIKELQDNGCGGGNFLMALGMFATIGFLANLYWILSGKDFNAPKDGDVKDDVSTEIAFGKLIKDVPSSVVNLGLLVAEAGRVWNYFRNKLAHIASPAQPVRTFSPSSPRADFLTHLARDNRPAFVKEDGHNWICEIDLLTFRVEQTKDWLMEKLDKNEFKYEDLARAFVWVQKNY